MPEGARRSFPVIGTLFPLVRPLLALPNGSRINTRSLLERVGLYRHAKPSAHPFVSAHAWDCLGAGNSGMTTGWVSRPEIVYSPAFGHPDVQGETLTAVADELLRFSSG